MKKILLLASIFGLTIISTLWISFGSVPTSEGAGTPSEISGYAWSSNIGWINFKGSSYGVVIDPDTGVLSGYAWSSNIGWISFNSSSPNDLVGCPSNPCYAKYENNTFSGWAKALSADGNGWDGWIHLAPTTGTSYGLTSSGTTISGFAWGGEVVGWVKSIDMRMTALECQVGADDDGDTIPNEIDLNCGFTPTECSDTVDNDGDTLIDFGPDLGCEDFFDNDERDGFISTTPVVVLKVGIGSPISESLNIGKNGADVKLGINISNASTATTCSKKTISNGVTTPDTINTGGLTTFISVQDLLNVTKTTKIEVSCTTDNKTGSDSVDIIIKSENEF